MVWTLVPFGLVAALVAGILVANVLANKSGRLSREQGLAAEPAEDGLGHSNRLAIVDEHGTRRLLSPEEVQLIKKLIPDL